MSETVPCVRSPQASTHCGVSTLTSPLSINWEEVCPLPVPAQAYLISHPRMIDSGNSQFLRPHPAGTLWPQGNRQDNATV